MTDPQSPKEFRFKRGAAMLNDIRQFSATEKAVFGLLVIGALVTALIMAARVNNMFVIEIPAYGGELREGMVGLPRTINPVLAVTDADRDLSALVYSGLTKYINGTFKPDLASSWDVSSDGLTYTFTIRNGARFQDGSAVTADDVVFTIQKIQDPLLKSPRQADWSNVAVKALSLTQVQFTLKQVYAPFLSNTTVGIMPKHIWGSVSDEQFIFSQYNTEPLGSGPYKTGSIARDQGGIPTEYSLTAWSGYYGKKPYISTLSFLFFSDQDKALAALDQGSIDSLASIPPAEAARLASDSVEGYTVVSAPLPRIFGVFFNQNQAPVLADANVRSALDVAVDRPAIVAAVLDGFGIPQTGPLPISIGGAAPASNGPDIVKARSILEKNGWKRNANGIYEKKAGKNASTTLAFDIYTADTQDLRQAAELVKDQWMAFGADVTVKVFEASDLYQNVIRPRSYGALLFGELVGKDRDLYAFWHSSQRNSPGLNISMYTNSTVDSLLEKIRSTSDDSARQAAYSALDQTIRADHPAVFLYAPDFIYAIPKSLRGVQLQAMTSPSDRFADVESWYIQTENVWKIFVR